MTKRSLAATVAVLLAFLTKDVTLQTLSTVVLILFIAKMAEDKKCLPRALFYFGMGAHLIAFYWLPETLKRFGGFPGWVALLLHLLFAVTASLQFWLAGYVYKKLFNEVRPPLGTFTLVWGVIDLLYPQLFPWTLAQPIIGFGPVASLAEIFGVTVLTCFLLFSAEVFIELFNTKFIGARRHAVFVILMLAVGALLHFRALQGEESAPKLKLALVQGVITLDEKFAASQLADNLAKYSLLSEKAVADGAQIVIWPETVFYEWTPASLQSIRGTPFDPAPELKVPLLYGALTFDKISGPKKYASYNGALLLDKDGVVKGNYAKKVLMPFGEYLPFERYFPTLRSISPASGDFTSGTAVTPLMIQLNAEIMKAVPLICYEDLVPSLGEEGVRQGGNIFVNITNDDWYGDTAAPWQHQLLAQWRTIEFRRVLVRATNTGLTSVTLPTGRLISHLPTYTQGTLIETVPLMEGRTLYSHLGDEVFTLLFAGILLVIKGMAMKKNA